MRIHRIIHLVLMTGALFIVLLVSGCVQSLPSAHSESPDVVVTNNLRQIWSLLHDAMGDGDSFPRTLAELNRTSVNGNLFICPGIRSQAASMSTVEEWGDYIYIGNVWEGVARAALIISPPENHGGNYGYVVCVDGYMTSLPPAQIRTLVNQPWRLDTNASLSNIDYLKKQLSIRVPKRLRPFYSEGN